MVNRFFTKSGIANIKHRVKNRSERGLEYEIFLAGVVEGVGRVNLSTSRQPRGGGELICRGKIGLKFERKKAPDAGKTSGASGGR